MPADEWPTRAEAMDAPLPSSNATAAAETTPTLPELPTPGDIRRLFTRLQIRRETDGRVIIEAPAEAASELGALFEGMAALMRSVASPVEGPNSVSAAPQHASPTIDR